MFRLPIFNPQNMRIHNAMCGLMIFISTVVLLGLSRGGAYLNVQFQLCALSLIPRFSTCANEKSSNGKLGRTWERGYSAHPGCPWKKAGLDTLMCILFVHHDWYWCWHPHGNSQSLSWREPIDNTSDHPGTLESRQHILNTIFLLHFNLLVTRIASTYLWCRVSSTGNVLTKESNQ